MEKRKDFSPPKREQVTFTQAYWPQTERHSHGSKCQTISTVRTNLVLGRKVDSSRLGKCGRKWKTTPRLEKSRQWHWKIEEFDV